MRLFTLLLLYLTPFLLASQSVNFEGKIIDSRTKAPIAYANIGVVRKNVGTVSDQAGSFTLNVDSKFAGDTMRISIIGYETLNIAVRELRDQLNQSPEISLVQQNLKIPEVVVVEQKLNSKILGNKTATRNMSLGFSTDTLGNEMAIRCKVKGKLSYLKTLNLHIADNPYDSIKFRINIYDSKNGKPNEVINTVAIYTMTSVEEGIHKVDLSPYNISTERDFFISFEWIEDLTHLESETNGSINFCSSFLGKPVYHKTTSHGTWKKLSIFGVTMNVEVLQ